MVCCIRIALCLLSSSRRSIHTLRSPSYKASRERTNCRVSFLQRHFYLESTGHFSTTYHSHDAGGARVLDESVLVVWGDQRNVNVQYPCRPHFYTTRENHKISHPFCLVLLKSPSSKACNEIVPSAVSFFLGRALSRKR